MVRTFASKSALSEAITLINAGQIDKAEAICRAGIERPALIEIDQLNTAMTLTLTAVAHY